MKFLLRSNGMKSWEHYKIEKRKSGKTMIRREGRRVPVISHDKLRELARGSDPKA